MTSSLDFSQAFRRQRHVVVVGGGLAGLRSVEELRRRSFDGEITMVCAESEPPYDRPPLSKGVLTGASTPEGTIYRGSDFFRDQGVTLLLGHEAQALDVQARILHAGGKLIDYTDLIICTGASPRKLACNNGQLEGVYELRTMNDARAVQQAFAGKPRVVVVGAGFIGAEVASSARALGLDVTIVEAAPAPLTRAVGGKMGAVCANLHGYNGSKLLVGEGVASIEGRGRVERVKLTDGSTLDCDLLVIGIGVSPNIEWLRGSGLNLSDGVVCDASLATNVPGIYAAGDVASWPNELFGARMRGEQWTNAVEQGRHVARRIVSGVAEPFKGSNYFWSDQYGVRIQFAGVADADEIVVVEGSTRDRKFIAWYRRGDRLVGALAMDSAKLLMFSKTLIERQASWREALQGLEKLKAPSPDAGGQRQQSAEIVSLRATNSGR